MAIEGGDEVYLAESNMDYLFEYSPKRKKVVYKKLQCILLGGCGVRC